MSWLLSDSILAWCVKMLAAILHLNYRRESKSQGEETAGIPSVWPMSRPSSRKSTKIINMSISRTFIVHSCAEYSAQFFKVWRIFSHLTEPFQSMQNSRTHRCPLWLCKQVTSVTSPQPNDVTWVFFEFSLQEIVQITNFNSPPMNPGNGNSF